jgi:hypothetical protein
MSKRSKRWDEVLKHAQSAYLAAEVVEQALASSNYRVLETLLVVINGSSDPGVMLVAWAI